MSNMNSGRLTSNRDKAARITIKDPYFNILSYAPLYELGSNGEIIKISNKQTVTKVKHYILKPVLVNSHNSAQVGFTPSPIYLSCREDVIVFFGISLIAFNKAILTNQPLLHTKTNISYFIIRIF